MPEVDPVPYWRYYWIATLKDGQQIPQFDAEGHKFLWHNLPEAPVAITLVPFTRDLAIKVRSASQIAALPIEALPVTIYDLGGGLLAGIDERRHVIPSVKCLSCGHTWPFVPNSKAECPACHAHDDWFCPECQTNRDPWVFQNMILCETCKARGMTRGLKRIMKFEIIADGMKYDFQHWVRTGTDPVIEYRAIRDKIVVGPYRPPQATPDPDKPE